MFSTWIVALLTMMVSTRVSNKLKRARKNKVDSKFITLDESKTKSEEWDRTVEGAKAAAIAKGKAPIEHFDSVKKKSTARKKKRTGGIHIEEPLASAPPPEDGNIVQIDTQQMKAFENRDGIGERHVNIGNLRDRSAAFGILFDQAGLTPICNFPEITGYCIHLIRTFYLRTGQLKEVEGGPIEFKTMVRNTPMTITPQTIVDVLGMKAEMTGIHYTKGHTLTSLDWRRVVDGVCMPDTRLAENSVFSKELQSEYRFLNFIVCYNILPNMQTKVVRWERLLYLYLLGHPLEA